MQSIRELLAMARLGKPISDQHVMGVLLEMAETLNDDSQVGDAEEFFSFVHGWIGHSCHQHAAAKYVAWHAIGKNAIRLKVSPDVDGPG